ncbi:flagellar hook-length control protein FliK [Burkholderia sp. WAC0059]|nr:flagellar hook-length control protein FliK [Burkholderia sp. WAC0059]
MPCRPATKHAANSATPTNMRRAFRACARRNNRRTLPKGSLMPLPILASLVSSLAGSALNSLEGNADADSAQEGASFAQTLQQSLDAQASQAAQSFTQPQASMPTPPAPAPAPVQTAETTPAQTAQPAAAQQSGAVQSTSSSNSSQSQTDSETSSSSENGSTTSSSASSAQGSTTSTASSNTDTASGADGSNAAQGGTQQTAQNGNATQQDKTTKAEREQAEAARIAAATIAAQIQAQQLAAGGGTHAGAAGTDAAHATGAVESSASAKSTRDPVKTALSATNGDRRQAAILHGGATTAAGAADAHDAQHLADNGASHGDGDKHESANASANADKNANADSSKELMSTMNADAAGKNTASALAAAMTAVQGGAAQAGAAGQGTALEATQAAAAALQQSEAAENPTASAQSGAASSLSPQVGTSDWEEALSQKVVFLSGTRQQSAELTLNPENLGPLQVVLQVSDNHAHALFVSQHQQVRDAVEAALPKLREAMEAGGIGLGSASVSDGFAGQSGQQDSEQKGGRSRASTDEDADADLTTASVTAPVRRTVGLVDTFA